MTPEELWEELGLRTPELDEQRARQAEEQWQEHLDKCAYEEWEAEQIELELTGGIAGSRSRPREQPSQSREKQRGAMTEISSSGARGSGQTAIWGPSRSDGAPALIAIMASQRGEDGCVDNHPCQENRNEVKERNPDVFHVTPSDQVINHAAR